MAETTKTYTEREVIVCERDAVKRTIDELWGDLRDTLRARKWVGAEAFAARLYPFPMVKRPRVIVEPDSVYEFRVVDGQLQSRHVLGDARGWVSGNHWSVTGKRIAMWADLFANPTELVEDDGSAAASPEGR